MAAALLLAAGLAAQVELHGPTAVPPGWAATGARAPRGEVFEVMVGLKRSNRAAMDRAVAEVSDPRGPKYLAYPTYEEVGELVRPAAQHTAAVKKWLAAHGVAVEAEHPHGDYIKVSATAAELEAMVGGEFVEFEHASSGGRLRRVVGGVRVPAEVAGAVDTVTGFTSFPLPRTLRAGPGPAPNGTCPVTPQKIREQYGIPEGPADGPATIQAIAQFQGNCVNQEDLFEFCENNDPTSAPCNISKTVGGDNKGGALESMLDTEYIMTVSPHTDTWVYSNLSADFCGGLLWFTSEVTAEATHPSVISISYGTQSLPPLCNAGQMARFESDVAKMALMGITVMVASGDYGSAPGPDQLNPSFPASAPHVTAVGGTYWESGHDGPEQASTKFPSGGGFSFEWDAPEWQKNATTTYLSTLDKKPSLKFPPNGRGTPDVSAISQYFLVQAAGEFTCVTGTSASSPLFAGLVTRLNRICLKASGKTLGFANPLFYQNPSMFTDITKGSNAAGWPPANGWKAIKGWDACTGLGTPNYTAMVEVVKAACTGATARLQ